MNDYVDCRLPFGETALRLKIPQANLIGVFTPQEHADEPDEAAIIRAALEKPFGTGTLDSIVKPGQKICIVTSDLTRPCPSKRLLPPILSQLNAAGVSDGDICIVMALGLHRTMTEAELTSAVGPEVSGRIRVLNHDPEKTVTVGVTSAGTPVELFSTVVEADVRICLGNLEFHYFAGFSGGAKAIVPGCASRATLNANHSMMGRKDACAGKVEDNPVRDDLEEGASMVGIDFILNVLVDQDQRVCGAVAGDFRVAHREGCKLVVQRGAIAIPRKGDIVVVGAGGFPSDVNMYQAQKALDNAARAVRRDGIIIWAAACDESLGNATFESWLLEAGSPDEILDRISRDFVLGGHKAAAMASVMQEAQIYMVSNLPSELVEKCGLQPFPRLDLAVTAAMEELGGDSRVLVLPQGGSVMPFVSSEAPLAD